MNTSLTAATRQREKQTFSQFATAIALSTAALSLILFSLNASAEITQDCYLEGTVDKRKADQLGQPSYVKFRNAERASEADCSFTRKSKSRRVKFVNNPDMSEIEDVEHGTRVRYRYIEQDKRYASWELMEVKNQDPI